METETIVEISLDVLNKKLLKSYEKDFLKLCIRHITVQCFFKPQRLRFGAMPFHLFLYISSMFSHD